jgi:mannosyltransferase
VAKCLGRPARVWVVRLGEQHDPLHGLGEQKEALLRQRYREDHVWRLRNMTLALLVLNTRRP